MATDAAEFIENVLQHKIDDGYNAAEAHAYYMRTRKLKGRKPAAPKPQTKSDEQKFEAKFETGMARLRKEAAKRAKDLPKLNPKQVETAKKWDEMATRVDAILEKSGLAKKENAIRYNDKLTKAEQASEMEKLHNSSPVYQKLKPVLNKLLDDFLAKPELPRYYEILYSQQDQKANALDDRIEKYNRIRLSGKPGKVRNAQL